MKQLNLSGPGLNHDLLRSFGERQGAPYASQRCSVVSLLIRYCGSSLEAWTVYPLNVIGDVIFFWIVPWTSPASEFQRT